MSETVKLTKRERDALDECARYTEQGRRYWWRRASMEKLAAAGLVRIAVQGSSARTHEYVPTEAGRAALLSQGDTSNG